MDERYCPVCGNTTDDRTLCTYCLDMAEAEFIAAHAAREDN